jgi:hypothetical protein
MKKYILSIVICAFFSRLSAQTSTAIIKKNSVYVEFLGSSPMLYNVTYDRLIVGEDKIRTSVALGLQYIFDSEIEGALNSDFTMTPQFNLLFGRKHYFEFGMGAAFPFGSESAIFPFRLGYRFQKEEGGLLFKAAFTPIYFPGDGFFGSPFLPWGGLSAGYTF